MLFHSKLIQNFAKMESGVNIFIFFAIFARKNMFFFKSIQCNETNDFYGRLAICGYRFGVMWMVG